MGLLKVAAAKLAAAHAAGGHIIRTGKGSRDVPAPTAAVYRQAAGNAARLQALNATRERLYRAYDAAGDRYYSLCDASRRWAGIDCKAGLERAYRFKQSKREPWSFYSAEYERVRAGCVRHARGFFPDWDSEQHRAASDWHSEQGNAFPAALHLELACLREGRA